MQEMNEWLDQEQSGHFSSLLQVESEFIEVAIAADCLLRAVRAKENIHYEAVMEIYSKILEEKLKLFDEMLNRRDERNKTLDLAMKKFEENQGENNGINQH